MADEKLVEYFIRHTDERFDRLEQELRELAISKATFVGITVGVSGLVSIVFSIIAAIIAAN